MLRVHSTIMLEKTCSTSLHYLRPTYICFKENGHTNVNTFHKPNKRLNISGTINPVASIFAIATKKRQTCREDIDHFRQYSIKKIYHLFINVTTLATMLTISA